MWIVLSITMKAGLELIHRMIEDQQIGAALHLLDLLIQERVISPGSRTVSDLVVDIMCSHVCYITKHEGEQDPLLLEKFSNFEYLPTTKIILRKRSGGSRLVAVITASLAAVTTLLLLKIDFGVLGTTIFDEILRIFKEVIV